MTNLQLHVTQKQNATGYSKYNLVVKEDPGSRKCPFMSHKSQRDVLLCGFLAEDKLLLKMRTDRKTESYWTLIDATGKIHPLPRTLRRVLNSEEWTDMSIQPIIDA